MLFKIGDKVLFKNDKQVGTVIQVLSSYKLVIETLDGFHLNVLSKDLILMNETTHQVSAYGFDFFHKENISYKEESRINFVNKKQKKSTLLTIDLHIESFGLDYKNMSNNEILEVQINLCKKKLDSAVKSARITTVMIIHGIGNGSLKLKVHELLKDYRLRYFLAQDEGSTKVML